MFTRRQLIQQAGVGLLATALPSIGFTRSDRDVRLVLVILRGAVDGLAIVPPYGDGSYRSVRGELALDTPGATGSALRLDGLFGLHPSLTNMHRMYGQGDAAIVHAVASPYRDRSHFDGQDILENGAAAVGELRDGWLNRAIGPIHNGHELAIAMAQNTPLVLRGHAPVTSWAPSSLPDARGDTLERVAMLYENDTFFASRLQQAMDSQEIAGDMGSMRRGGRGNDIEQWKSLAASTARFLTAENGPQVAVLEAGGWDTHANQGASSGQLANRLTGLDQSLEAFRVGMGDDWEKTVVCVVTEFGRTVSVNGTRGTDHGTASAALLLGGAVDGGRVIADWPGLRPGDLYEGRDLHPTADLRSLFKGILLEHLGLDEARVEGSVFPDSRSAPAMTGLIRT